MVEMLSNNNSEQLNVSKETYDKVAENFDGKNTNEELANVLAKDELLKNLTNTPERNELIAAENAIKQICRKDNIDEIKMSDLKILPDYKKNQLAWELAACHRGFYKTIFENTNYLRKNAKIIGGKLGLKQLQKRISVATGDGSSTAGIGGEKNIGKEYFNYGTKITEERNLYFGPKGPAIVYISAIGEDINKDNEGGGKCVIDFGNDNNLTLNYCIDGIKIDNTNTKLPVGVSYDESTGKLIIPENFKGKAIKITTKSNTLGQEFDEVSFNFYCENADIKKGIASDTQEYINGNVNQGLGKFDISQEDKTNLKYTILTACEQAVNYIDPNLEMNLNLIISTDSTKFIDPDKFINDNKDITFKSVLDQFGDRKDIVKDCLQKIYNQIPKIDENLSSQENAQNRLLQLRFLSMISLFKGNLTFAQAISSGKLKFNCDFVKGAKERGIFISDE